MHTNSPRYKAINVLRSQKHLFCSSVLRATPLSVRLLKLDSTFRSTLKVWPHFSVHPYASVHTIFSERSNFVQHHGHSRVTALVLQYAIISQTSYLVSLLANVKALGNCCLIVCIFWSSVGFLQFGIMMHNVEPTLIANDRTTLA